MSLTISAKTLFATTSNALKDTRSYAKSSHVRERDWTIDLANLDDKGLKDLFEAAEKSEDSKVARAVESIMASRRGEFGVVLPSFKAFQPVLEAYLKQDAVDGWVFVRQADGNVLPELVIAIEYDDGMNRYKGQPQPSVTLKTIAYGLEFEGGERYAVNAAYKSHHFSPSDGTRRRIADALSAKGIYKETKPLKADYTATMARHKKLFGSAFGQQFRFTGKILEHQTDGWQRRGESAVNRKVIWDLDAEDYRSYERHHDCPVLKGGAGNVPEHPHVRLYDLDAHEYIWVNSAGIEPYRYDKSLKDKLVLPETHRDLLDVLTNDITAFTGDIIEGKAAGNAILAKGAPGLGKTLSAEVYAELMERPLVKIHSGKLGTLPEEIQENLQTFFRRAKRWNAVLLLDECDVFVMTRGSDPVQNAIVAEFLRALEYFDGLLFLTTNRPDDIDEAILDRCIAIIDYEMPDEKRLARIWKVQSDNFGADLAKPDIDRLVHLMPTLKPRDVKMLLSVTLRVAKARKRKPTIDDFRHCAIFRGLKLKAAAPVA